MRDIYYDDDNQVLKNKLGITNEEKLNKAQADFTILRTKELLDNDSIGIDENSLRFIHYHMFQDLFDWAGCYRKLNIEKPERVLNGFSIEYEDYQNIDKRIKEIFVNDQEIDLNRFNDQEKLLYISDLMINIWKCHPFRDGNTRTVIIFICNYCKKKGLEIKDDLLLNNCGYVRSSLVAASFSHKALERVPKKEYLYRIMEDMLNVKKEIKVK